LSGRGLCDELITRPVESYRLCCVVVCDLETSKMSAPYIYIYIYIYIYDISRLRVNAAREIIAVFCVNKMKTLIPPVGITKNFLGAFVKLRSASGSFVMSVCPSAWNDSVPTK